MKIKISQSHRVQAVVAPRKSWVFLWLLLPTIIIQSSEAFVVAPRSSAHRSRWILPSTLEEEKAAAASTSNSKELSAQDEKILFGPDSTSSELSSATASRSRNIAGNDRILTTAVKDAENIHDPVALKLHALRNSVSSCPALWKELAAICPNERALFDERSSTPTVDLTFSEMDVIVRKSAAAFAKLGVQKGHKVAFLAENSANWLLADQGLQFTGGISAVRGADAPIEELQYIYKHSDAAGIAVLQGPKLLKKLAQSANRSPEKPLGLHNELHGPVKTIVLLNHEKQSSEQIQKLAQEVGLDVVLFADLLKSVVSPMEGVPALTREDVSTIVYTSGTTGSPKGVLLTHGNLLHQTTHRLGQTKDSVAPWEQTEPLPGECMLSLLPIWHITERAFELWMASRGCAIVYSSIRTFKNDLAKHKPQWLVLVPRVLEKVAAGVQDKFQNGSTVVKILSTFFTTVSKTYARYKSRAQGLVVANEPLGTAEKLSSRLLCWALTPLQAIGNKLVWSKVADGFGGNVKTIISGGSALSSGLEEFYQGAGIPVCVGYGLTECAPLLSFRRSTANLVTAGCAGTACVDTRLQIVDPETKKPVAIGEIGVVWGKGPQVMKGYYKNPEATSKVIRDGWFDTGDLGRINPATGDLILTGRAKDTIVLSNGENIEPTPIEDAILSSSDLIDQIMLTGQDGRRLVAIVVLNPTALSDFASNTKDLQTQADIISDPKCTPKDAVAAADALNLAVEQLRSNASLKKQIMGDVQAATKQFRKWEQVGDICLTLEPFAMVNGMLTQSYKVKRAAVQDRYKSKL